MANGGGADLSIALAGCVGAIVGRETVDRSLLNSLPTLRVISKYGVGLDNLDHVAMAERGVRLVYSAGINRVPVAEHTIGLCIGMMRGLFRTGYRLRSGDWIKEGGRDFFGSRVAVVGMGAIGAEVARILKVGFACDVVVVDIADRSDRCHDLGVRQVGLEEALMSADLVTLHIPLTDRTRGWVDERFIATMRPGSYLCNTSRGEIINESAVLRALDSGHLSGAAFDVFSDEPVRGNDHPLVQHPHFWGTPHTAGNSQGAVLAMGRAAIRNLREAVATLGEPA